MILTIPHGKMQRQSNMDYSRVLFLLFLESDFIPSAYYYRSEEKKASFFQFRSPVVTEDLGFKLMGNLLEARERTVEAPPIRVQELFDWERILKKLKALEEVVGLLNDLAREELESFNNIVQRRPLFKNE